MSDLTKIAPLSGLSKIEMDRVIAQIQQKFDLLATVGSSAGVSASVSVPSAGVSIIVLGIFPVSYRVSGSPSWMTAWTVSLKSTSSFTVTFATPAPDDTSTFDWVVTS